jgi:hypothetical protein
MQLVLREPCCLKDLTARSARGHGRACALPFWDLDPVDRVSREDQREFLVIGGDKERAWACTRPLAPKLTPRGGAK